MGDTSVFRFCKSMELKGYQEFKMVLSLSLNENEKETSGFTGNIGLNDTFHELAQKVLNTNVHALTETHSLLDEKVFNQTIDWLHEAKKVYFFGVGASVLTALKAANKFLRIEPKVYCIQDSHMQAMVASTMNADEVAVVFSHREDGIKFSVRSEDPHVHAGELIHAALQGLGHSRGGGHPEMAGGLIPSRDVPLLGHYPNAAVRDLFLKALSARQRPSRP